MKSGHITVENVTINAIDMPVNLTAYQTITLKPGTHIRSGAVFSAKIEGCPEYNGDDSNINSFSIDEDGNVSESRSRVSVYPNPTREIINIDMNEVLPEVLFYEIYDMSGRLLARNIPQNNVEEYRFLGQSSGLFLVRIVYRDRTEEIKKVILDQ